MSTIQIRIESWKKKLLDMGKRNRLINFKVTKRSNITITSPNFVELYNSIVIKEMKLKFPFPQEVSFDDEGEEVLGNEGAGDVSTNLTLAELQKTLKPLRAKAKISNEEQGVNSLYLAFGLLIWREAEHSKIDISSPIILVPVRLSNNALASPYILSLHDDEVVVNPSLRHKLKVDFGIDLPEFDDATDPESYLDKVLNIVKHKGWKTAKDVNLTLLSFLKINMYKDLERNEERLKNNPIISAIVGDSPSLTLPRGYENYDLDSIKPIDNYQVMNADSSQQDAILLSKKGISFVLQGPPGTGKSQTITNIIAEALADGKKVLFVSEKMAALQVVHNRLSQVGLSDFCLSLHSHKANKKAILEDLDKSLRQSKISVTADSLDKLQQLELLRSKVNEYHKELHENNLPLNKSIYEVNGILASLHSITKVVFDIEQVDQFASERLNMYRFRLEEFVGAISGMNEHYSINPWRNTTILNVTHELRHDIESHFKILIAELQTLHEKAQSAIIHFELTQSINNVTINGVDNLIEILNTSKESPKIQLDWITGRDIDKLYIQAQQYKDDSERIANSQTGLTQRYGENIFKINGEVLRKSVEENTNKLRPLLNSSYSKDILDWIAIINEKAIYIDSNLNKFGDRVKSLSEEIGIQTPNEFSSMLNFICILDLLKEQIKPTSKWFNQGRFDQIKELDWFYNQALSLHKDISDKKQLLLKDYDNEIFGIDHNAILKRYRTDYRSWYRVFNHQYRKDRKSIQALRSDSKCKLNDTIIIQLLDELGKIANKTRQVNENEEKYITYFGTHYAGFDTNWDKLAEVIQNFKSLIELLPDKYVSDCFRKLLIDGTLPTSEITSLSLLFSTIDVAKVITTAQELVGNSIDHHSNIPDLKVRVSSIIKYGESINTDYNKFKGLTDSLNSQMFFADLDALVDSQKFYEKMEQEKESLQQHYGLLWKEIVTVTDWDTIIYHLEFADAFKSLVEKHSLPHEYIKRICSDDGSIVSAREMVVDVEMQRGIVNNKLKWAFKLFNDSEDLLNTNLISLISRFTDCYTKISSLDEWVDYRNKRKRCVEVGLKAYIEKVEHLGIEANLISGTYLKRFYGLWLDKQLPKYPAVQFFKGRSHEKDIIEFKTLDEVQRNIARSRIKEKVLTGFPDLNSPTTPRDELGVLTRELQKKKKLLPLRRLFYSIPNLLKSLKPCFMMSPLSVSVFLEANSYEFDLIIFDEASQVRTEDAIGAIMRGKQLIVVGDSKQLPPTNFFASLGLADDDDDDGDGIGDGLGKGAINAYESILDEALIAIPEKSLLWHYRSRHEHLIAFSNAKIYHHKLITFPSNQEKVKDLGVEYIYVPNGVYGRAGKRHNAIEANKVAELVFDHFRKYPKRSLGVVAFSEAQQQAIETSINQQKLTNSNFDFYFSEDSEEPFFVKNLENVQGDERDTIIFSIGYAKDSNGLMHMNFGPLSKEGGDRRLNVAITRAKFNVKLVGSIKATDIDTSKTTSNGPKLLRSYINFAKNGMSELEGELKYTETIQLESPFEESVFYFLLSKGYNVVTQVGCSGFRIDMAVRHPNHVGDTGVFVLGIECDGATYHSSRTARERDVLRQSVLEGMGWRIYRIWSTDWIKDQNTTGLHLITAIEKAVEEFGEPKLECREDVYLINNEIEITIDSPVSTGYEFAFYEEAVVDYQKPPKDLIKEILLIEQPMHIEYLCQRMAPVWDNQKVTSKIRDHVKKTIKSLKDDIVYKGEFVSFTSLDMSLIKARIPNGEDKRPFEYICVEELADVMNFIVNRSYGINLEPLKQATAREFGFARVGQKISERLDMTYQYLLKEGRVKESDEKILSI